MRTIVVFFIVTVCSLSSAIVRVNTITQGWADKQADIYFTMDSSTSIWIKDYRKMLSVVADMVSGMDIGPNKTRVGLGLFSRDFREFISINNGLSKDSLVNRIKNAPYITGNGFISRAIEGVRTKGLAPTVIRKGVPLITILFTDDESRYPQLTLDNSTLAKKEGIYIYTVGLAKRVDKMELREIASDPKDDFTFWIPNAASLVNIKRTLMKSMSEVQFLQADEATCGKKDAADVVFVFDEYVLGKRTSTMVKKFIRFLVGQFSMDSGNIRAGTVSKTCHKGDISLGQFLTQEAFLSKIDNEIGLTTSTVLRRARLDGFLPEIGGRTWARKRIILFLEGEITETFRLKDEARRAKYSRIEVFIVAINVTIKKGILENMATSSDHITHVDSPSSLQDDSARESFMKVFCRELN